MLNYEILSKLACRRLQCAFLAVVCIFGSLSAAIPASAGVESGNSSEAPLVSLAEAEMRSIVLETYVRSASQWYFLETGIPPSSLADIVGEGLMLKRAYNHYAGRMIPLDGSCHEIGDIWLEMLPDGTAVVVLMTHTEVRKRQLQPANPNPVLNPRSERDMVHWSFENVYDYYHNNKIHRYLFYQASIIASVYTSFGFDSLDAFRTSLYFPDLDYARNLVTGEPLREYPTAGNFELLQLEVEHMPSIRVFDEYGELLPDWLVVYVQPGHSLEEQIPGRLAREPIPLLFAFLEGCPSVN